MKNIKWLLIALAAACLTTACGGSSDDPGQPGNGNGNVVGEWHMLSWSSAPAAADVYLSFDETGAFDLYQRYTRPTYEHFSGTYSYAGGKLSGLYSDNAAWGNSYKVTFNGDGSQMTLIGVAGTADVAVFARAPIPEEIRSGELEAAALQARSEQTLRFL
ncbi:MAG TPA: hypothetical protein PKZ47_04145 [Alistipes sp.]|uniref:lipocalin family protein n=1 Tax=unclassified Alistipes TaxID=2608932 RepID=UPI0025909D1D|nr:MULTISPECIES: lipocalin family protein [unclassified Alistipes]HUN14205.1 hypothetical protein [Alistipes sp.]